MRYFDHKLYVILENHDAFLQSIQDNIDDWGPKLQYADWLEERGDPLGRAIWTLYEATQIPDPPEPQLWSIILASARSIDEATQGFQNIKQYIDEQKIENLTNKITIAFEPFAHTRDLYYLFGREIIKQSLDKLSSILNVIWWPSRGFKSMLPSPAGRGWRDRNLPPEQHAILEQARLWAEPKIKKMVHMFTALHKAGVGSHHTSTFAPPDNQ